MTADQMALHVLAVMDPGLNLSPQARVLILHVLRLEKAEIAFATLRRLLQLKDDKKLRLVISEAEDAGWIAYEWRTGKGHNPSFEFRVPKKGSPNADSLPNFGSPNGSHAGASSPPPPSPTTPPPTPSGEEGGARVTPIREPDPQLDEIRKVWGDGAVDAALGSKILPRVKLLGLWGLYGPHGTVTDRRFGRSPPEWWGGAVATAVTKFALDAPQYDNRLFERYLDRAEKGEPDDQHGNGSGGNGNGRGRGRSASSRRGGAPPPADAEEAARRERLRMYG